MGVDIDGKLMVGLKGSELDFNNVEGFEEDPYEALEKAGFEYATPWFDCDDHNYWIVGVSVGDLDLSNDDFMTVINNAKEKFGDIFGKPPKLIGTQNVW